jgi:hypothetical protein
MTCSSWATAAVRACEGFITIRFAGARYLTRERVGKCGVPLRNVLMGGVSAGALTHLMSIPCVPPITHSPKEQGKDPLCLSEC